jgi:hypothetical protein
MADSASFTQEAALLDQSLDEFNIYEGHDAAASRAVQDITLDITTTNVNADDLLLTSLRIRYQATNPR